MDQGFSPTNQKPFTSNVEPIPQDRFSSRFSSTEKGPSMNKHMKDFNITNLPPSLPSSNRRPGAGGSSLNKASNSPKQSPTSSRRMKNQNSTQKFLDPSLDLNGSEYNPTIPDSIVKQNRSNGMRTSPKNMDQSYISILNGEYSMETKKFMEMITK